MDRKTKLASGQTVSKKDLEALLRKVNSEVSIGHKLKPLHLECQGMDRQCVRLACELISQTVAALMRHYFPGKAPFADLIEIADSVFNLMTAEKLENSDFTRSAFGGPNYEKQLELLTEFKDLISRTVFYGKTRFDSGMTMAISAIIQLQKDLEDNHNISQLRTNRTTQA